MNPVERRLPELTPAQIANLTASLAPGAASVDIAGEFPQFPSREMTTEEMLAGPRAPSLAENLAEGEYFSGIMQALGGLGDSECDSSRWAAYWRHSEDAEGFAASVQKRRVSTLIQCITTLLTGLRVTFLIQNLPKLNLVRKGSLALEFI